MSYFNILRYIYKFGKYKQDHPRYLLPISEATLLQRLTSQEISHKKIIFDVGAHIGETLLKYDKIFTSEIHCFEPFIDSFNLLQSAAQKCKSEHVLNNLGLSDENGNELLYCNNGSPTNSTLPLHENFEANWSLKQETIERR